MPGPEHGSVPRGRVISQQQVLGHIMSDGSLWKPVAPSARQRNTGGRLMTAPHVGPGTYRIPVLFQNSAKEEFQTHSYTHAPPQWTIAEHRHGQVNEGGLCPTTYTVISRTLSCQDFQPLNVSKRRQAVYSFPQPRRRCGEVSPAWAMRGWKPSMHDEVPPVGTYVDNRGSFGAI